MPKVPLYLLLRVMERLEWWETRRTNLQEKLSPDHGEKLDSNIACKDGATSNIQFGKCVKISVKLLPLSSVSGRRIRKKWRLFYRKKVALPVTKGVEHRQGINKCYVLCVTTTRCKRKIKSVSIHTMKEFGRVEVQLHSFSTSTTAVSKWQASNFRRFAPR
jgi:hypothetical protein